MNSVKIVTVLTFSVFTTFVFGQNSSTKKWKKHLTYLETKYQDLPKQKLDSITIAIDSTAIGGQCFKFISNAASSKFLAFYITDKNGNGYKEINREYGGIYHRYTWGEKKASEVEAFAYTVTGMYYNNKWYYDVGEFVEFYADNIEEAKNIFLIRTLRENKFFIGKNPKENKHFWEKGEFDKNVYPYKEEYPNIPLVVVRSSIREKVRETHNDNKNLEQIACTFSSNIWNDLHSLDSTMYYKRYIGTYMDSYCLTLYNSDRNTVLLPIIYFDILEKAHLKYYVLKLSSKDTVLYTWKKFEEKAINRDKGKEGLEVVYDIRNFITNWGWGTVNMISYNDFWENNFTAKDIEISKYQYSSR